MTDIDLRYDAESDALVAKQVGATIVRSVSVGDLTLDIGDEERVVGMQVLNASDIVEFSDDIADSRRFLEHLDTASLQTRYHEDGVIVLLRLQGEVSGTQQEARISSMAPAVGTA
ncbi:MAG: DUF2283 domain-containing protein [Candidatus Nanohaloarchaea archaeon]|nr:DUF2283 domain-containing protein [Candidatus Nanohaloarchaea archaeon]